MPLADPRIRKKESDEGAKSQDGARNVLFYPRQGENEVNVVPSIADPISPAPEGRTAVPSMPQARYSFEPAGALSTLRGSLPTVSSWNFLVPGVHEMRTAMETNIQDVLSGRRQFTSLPPQYISKRIITNTFQDVMTEYQVIELSSVLLLLEEQYEVSIVGPANHYPRWALVNAVIAIALRAKIAPGAEPELSTYPRAFYLNATTVLPDLILQQPSLLSVQALLAIAIFAREVPGTHAFVTLATNALRQLELLMLGRGSLSASQFNVTDEHRLRQVRSVAYAFDALLTQQYGLHPLLHTRGLQ